MAVSIIKRPYAYTVGPYIFPPSTSITNSSGTAIFDVGANHNLTTGQVVYIYCSISAYNGYWPVTITSSTAFKLQTATGFVAFTSGSVGVHSNFFFKYAQSQYTHKWNCLHLPIVYILQSNLWPNNTVDTSQTVSSFANDSNYTKLTCSGSLGSFNALAYVKISGANSSAVNGNWQILTKTSSSVITINLPYNAGYDFTNGIIILYYNNYHVSINIWSGLTSSHTWSFLNPYVKLTSINVVPDNNNLVKFNLNEYLKADVNVLKNNLALDSLPNNIDGFTQFYIEYAELYDTSNGTSVSTFNSGYTSDQSNFEGYAQNSKLPFKTRESGMMSNYVFGGGVTSKFLTNFTQPTFWAGRLYFDLSFIVDTVVPSNIVQDIYVKGVLKDSIKTSITTIGATGGGPGVYRFPLTQSAWKEDQQKVYLVTNNSKSLSDNTFTNSPVHSPYTKVWSSSTTPSITYTNAGFGAAEQDSVWYFVPFYCTPGSIIVCTYNVTISGYSTTGGGQIGFFATQSYDNLFYTLLPGSNFGNFLYNANGTYSGSFNITTPSTPVINFIGFGSLANASFGNTVSATITVNSLTFSVQGQPATSVASEVKTIDVNNYCYDQNYYLTWLNPLGGFDYWNFTGRSDHDRQINSVTTQQQNIFSNWPNSWGEFADTVVNESKRQANVTYLLRSQNLTKDQLDAIAEIKDSPLVQLINNDANNYGLDRRTLLLDKSSFHIRKDGDKTFNISFTAVYTDFISAQEL